MAFNVQYPTAGLAPKYANDPFLQQAIKMQQAGFSTPGYDFGAGSVGYNPTQVYQKATTIARPSSQPGGTFGTPVTGAGAGGAAGGALGAFSSTMNQFTPQSIMQNLLNFRPQFLQQQQNLLNQYGSSLRTSILGASPELSQAADFYQSRFQNPIPPELEAQFAERIRGAQAARGFGGGGTGPVGEEARYLTGLAEEQRLKLLPGMQQFGAGILGMSGLAGPPNLASEGGLNAFANMFGSVLRNQQFQQQLGFEQQQAGLGQEAAEKQSQFAQQYYNWLKQQISSGYGDDQGSPVGSNYWNPDLAKPWMNYGF